VVISPQVELEMPKINAYVVQGQSLDDVSQVYSNVTAESLAQANNIQPDAVLRVGAPLTLPEDAWGSAPPAATNPGAGCVQYAVPNSVYNQITGSVTPAPSVTPPAEVSRRCDRSVAGYPGFDWLVTADGNASRRTRAPFRRMPRLDHLRERGGPPYHHRNGKKDDGDFGPAWRDTHTDVQRPGSIPVHVHYHPDMKAWLFVK
jgi:hypothetical protein